MGVALLALLVAVSGAAVAGIPSEGTITACYNKNSGALRVMDTEDSQPQPCSPKETQLAWNDGSTLLGKDEKAADSDKLDGLDSTNFLPDGDLQAGTTLRGRYDIFGNSTGSSEEFGADGISFVYTFRSPPQEHLILSGATRPPACPGSAGSPEALPGHLCVYEQNRENIAPGWPNFYVLDPYGFGVWAPPLTEGHYRSYGTWAVTAPTAATAQRQEP
jgi:hypothetical protein